MYKNKLCSLILLASLALPASAQSVNLPHSAVTRGEGDTESTEDETTGLYNLLESCLYQEGIDQWDDPDSFYAKWKCYYKDGSEVGTDDRLYSAFVLLEQEEDDLETSTSNSTKWITFKGKKDYDYGANDGAGFQKNAHLLVLDYPNKYSKYAECFYSAPVTIPFQDTYTVTAGVHHYTSGKIFSSYTTILKYAMVFVFEKNIVGNKTFNVVSKNGVSVIEVKNGDGEILPSAYVVVPNASGSDPSGMNTQVELSPEYKYMSIYAPDMPFMVASPVLTSNNLNEAIQTGIVPFSDDISNRADFSDAPAEWFDLSGRRLSSCSEPSTKGVYILRQGSKSKLILR